MPPSLSRAQWKKSTRSNGNDGDCVELAWSSDYGAIQDSKNTKGSILVVDQTALQRLIHSIKTDNI